MLTARVKLMPKLDCSASWDSLIIEISVMTSFPKCFMLQNGRVRRLVRAFADCKTRRWDFFLAFGLGSVWSRLTFMLSAIVI